LLRHLSTAGRLERGGVLLGSRGKQMTVVTAAVFPPQIASGPDHCIFSTRSIERIRSAGSSVRGQRLRSLTRIVGWVHTHPKLGVFLSGTDRATLATWQQLDPSAVAVVVDPFADGDEVNRIAYWYANDGRPGTAVAAQSKADKLVNIRDAVAMAEAIRQAGTPHGGVWEFVTTHNAVHVYPDTAEAQNPAVSR